MGPSPVHRKPSSYDSLNSLLTLLFRRHLPFGGEEATSRFTCIEIIVPNLIDENFDELSPRRDPEGQDLEDDQMTRKIRSSEEIWKVENARRIRIKSAP